MHAKKFCSIDHSSSNDGFSKDTILEIQTFDDVSQISIDPSNEIYFKDETGNSNYDVVGALEVDASDVFNVQNDANASSPTTYDIVDGTSELHASDVIDVTSEEAFIIPSAQFLVQTTCVEDQQVRLKQLNLRLWSFWSRKLIKGSKSCSKVQLAK